MIPTTDGYGSRVTSGARAGLRGVQTAPLLVGCRCHPMTPFSKDGALSAFPSGFIAAPSYQRVIIRDPVRIVNIIHQTRNVTNYTVVNNIVVNKSVDVRVVERATGHPVPVMHAAAVIRNPNLVARVDVGQRV